MQRLPGAWKTLTTPQDFIGQSPRQQRKVWSWRLGPPELLGNEGLRGSRGLCLLPCCLAHDCCYERVKHLGCQPVLNGYQFRVVNGTVICECALGPGVSCLCGLRACECDTQSAYCFRENLPTYEKNFKQLSSRPHCGKHRPQC
ncbi:putative inactive group IIC secretory phospholipase A2 isoform X3 [Bos indicus]|uniref:Inactive group IIC secretory phospholipase A2 isoform X3 n=1 Tax=Bos indicus TaxID=9915 RepID=A0ABM4RE04_BOSIN